MMHTGPLSYPNSRITLLSKLNYFHIAVAKKNIIITYIIIKLWHNITHAFSITQISRYHTQLLYYSEAVLGCLWTTQVLKSGACESLCNKTITWTVRIFLNYSVTCFFILKIWLTYNDETEYLACCFKCKSAF